MMWTLPGIAVVVAGFEAQLNPLPAVAAAAAVIGIACGMPALHIIEAFGKAFAANRFVGVAFLVLPVIGILERYGLLTPMAANTGPMAGLVYRF